MTDNDGIFPSCKYNGGVECTLCSCPRACGWRPQTELLRKRLLRGGQGLKTGPDGLRFLPVRGVRR